MISLPKSGFNARVLLLGADRLRLFHWRGGAVSDSGLFETGARARADFKAYLAARPADPVYLLVDSAQEEFRQETIPARLRRGQKGADSAQTGAFIRSFRPGLCAAAGPGTGRQAR